MKGLLKYTAYLLCLIWSVTLLSGCGKTAEPVQEKDELHIYASFYPVYAIAEKLMEDVPEAQLHCLVQPQDGCLRDYQLSDWDLALLERSADMVIIGGRGLESFENTLYSLGENGPAVAAVLYNKELLPGMIETADAGEENHWQDANPQLYMDAEGGILIAESIAAQMMMADPENTEIYQANLEDANNRLQSVIEKCNGFSREIAGKKVILMNEAAVYIAESCGLEVEGCIIRDSGEAFYDYELEKVLAQLSEYESRVILIEEQAPERFCEALEGAGFVIAKIDTMSAKRADEGFEGYLHTLEENTIAVADALETIK